MIDSSEIKMIIGLGNPGSKFYHTRHNIGFRIIDLLCDKYNCTWQNSQRLDISEIIIRNHTILLIKPQTFMNSSGEIFQNLKNKGIKPENVLVLHDELERPFGDIKVKFGGSSKGHNGLKSIISFIGPNFYRLRFGIGRPNNKEEVPAYVLSKFDKNEENQIEELINIAITEIEKICI